MNEHDRLVELYHAGDCELVFQLMDGLGLEWLDLGIDYDSKSMSHHSFTPRSFDDLTIYSSGFNDITLLDGESEGCGYCKKGLIPLLKKLDMLHLKKYIKKDDEDYDIFSHDLPKEELYKLIFKKV